MTWIDLLIIGIVVISSVISVVRGFVKEAISLAGWVGSFLIAWHFNGGMVSLLSGVISNQSLQFVVGFFLLFIVSMLIFALLNFFASKLVQRTGLTGTDRSIGVVFGFARGVLLVVAFVALAGLTTLPRSDSWRSAMLITVFQPVAVWLTQYLPNDMAKNFVFD